MLLSVLLGLFSWAFERDVKVLAGVICLVKTEVLSSIDDVLLPSMDTLVLFRLGDS